MSRQARRALLCWSLITTSTFVRAAASTSCVKRSAILYTSDASTFTVLSCPSAVTLEPPTTTIFASNFSCPVPTSTGAIQDGTFEGDVGFPFSTSDHAATSNGLTASYEVTSQGPFQPYAGSQYLLVTFSQTNSKRDVLPTTGGTFNISQLLPTTQDGAVALSVYARARSVMSTDPANCTVMLCNDGTCSNPLPLTADWTFETHALMSSSTGTNNAIFSVWCAAPAYVGFDNLAVNRAVAMTSVQSMSPSSPAEGSTVTVTSTVYQSAALTAPTLPPALPDRTVDHTITLTPPASTETTTLISQDLTTNVATYTTILPASTITVNV